MPQTLLFAPRSRMPYQLWATKLQTYHRCPQAYFFRYELGLKTATFFGSTALGTALHQALAQSYRDWHYLDPLPKLDWFHHCWQQNSEALSPAQVEEGLRILENYYNNFIAGEVVLHRPLAVEGSIQGILRVQNLEFKISGRCDRIDYVEDGLELIDYKSTRAVKLPNPDEMDLQIDLYYLALEKRYRSCLQKLSLVYLRTGDKVSFDATPEHKQLVEVTISDLAFRLRTDEMWEASPGEHCDRYTYAQYCAAVQEQPEPLPQMARSSRQMQLVLSI